VTSAARAVAASIISLAIVIAASGWLYLIQPRDALPGPPVGDALPLDELSRRSAVPLLVFLAVWGPLPSCSASSRTRHGRSD
jgi:hypothetical protein